MLKGLEEQQLSWNLVPGSNSIGFLIRHIAEVEYRFAQMFFQSPVPEQVTLDTIGPVRDEGNYTELASLLAFKDQSYAHLLQAMSSLPDADWDTPCEAPIGILTPRQALGRLTYHMGHHSGQISLIRKYGGKQKA